MYTVSTQIQRQSNPRTSHGQAAATNSNNRSKRSIFYDYKTKIDPTTKKTLPM